MADVPVDAIPNEPPLRRVSPRNLPGQPARAGSPWSDGHETELRRRADLQIEYWRARAKKAESDNITLRAAMAAKVGAVGFMQSGISYFYVQARALRLILARWDPRNWAELCILALRGTYYSADETKRDENRVPHL